MLYIVCQPQNNRIAFWAQKKEIINKNDWSKVIFLGQKIFGQHEKKNEKPNSSVTCSV